MPRRLRAIIALALAILANPCPAEPPTEWPYDVLRLKNGATVRGLVLEEPTGGVRFRIVRRATGRPTVWFNTFFSTPEVVGLDKLSDADRATLKAKLEEIDPSPQAEARRLERVDLKPIEWLAKGKGLRYESDYFTLESNAPAEIVRRAAYRLENVYAAFARFQPPRHRGGSPTMIHVHGTLEGYQKAVPDGIALKNPAFYDPTANRIVSGTDLQKLGDELAQFRTDAKRLLDELAEQEATLVKLYGKKPDELARHVKPIKDRRATIEAIAKQNDATFERATRQAFQTLYHEAFHAYIGCFVFPAGGTGPGSLPRWLNEGLAQIFETAVFEAGELRIGHADRARLEKAQEILAKSDFPPVTEILTAGPRVFVIAHDAERPAVDRAYAATWVLAAYLSFDRQLLGSAALDEFVRSTNAKADPVKSFEALVGQPIAEFEKWFHDWLTKLKPNGSLTELR